MMTISFMPMEFTTFIQCRRGKGVFRRKTLLPNIKEIDYPVLQGCAIEIVDIRDHVWSRADVLDARGGLTLTYLGPPPKLKDPTIYSSELKAMEEKLNEGTTTPEPRERTQEKDTDNVQQVGGVCSTDGEALRRAVHSPG